MKVRFLLDENLPPLFRVALQRYHPAIDILRVGDEEAPPLGTLDPDILRYLDQAQRILVTDNRATMPDHADEHLNSGGQHWGILEIRPQATKKQVIDTLCLLWEASEAEEWINQIQWIPF